MDPVVVRMERPADREAIRAVHDAAFGQPDDAWLARPLVDTGLIPRGVVRYPPAFAVHP